MQITNRLPEHFEEGQPDTHNLNNKIKVRRNTRNKLLFKIDRFPRIRSH